jgi:hypothetical protein
MTEGNMAVMLTDISLTPNATLGRKLYNFTATMYEIGDGYSLESLSSLGIIDIIDEKKLSTDDEDEFDSSDFLSHYTVGQIPSFVFPLGPDNSASVVKGRMAAGCI